MNRYTHEECAVCKVTFKDGDDVVVCPYCGTQIVIDGGEYNRGYSFCGECGAKVEFKK